MITKKCVVLVVTNETHMGFLKKFEALEEIESIMRCRSVWQKNKTPFILKDKLKNNNKKVEEVELENKEWSISEFIEFCYKNGFEPGEYITGEVYDTRDERCILCELANHKGIMNSLVVYNANVDNEVDCIIYESPNFFVVPELGSIITGFLMIVPKQHYLSVAQMPRELMKEYNEVCADVEKILEAVFSEEVTFFEHGSGPSGLTSHKKSIVHAHTHVVAGFKLKKKYQKMVQMVPIYDISIAYSTHYFSYQEKTTGQLLISMDPEVYVQRQFPRQVMAMELGLAPGQYNWRNVKFSENVKTTLYRIHSFLKKYHISRRIYERTKDFVDGYERREDFRSF